MRNRAHRFKYRELYDRRIARLRERVLLVAEQLEFWRVYDKSSQLRGESKEGLWPPLLLVDEPVVRTGGRESRCCFGLERYRCEDSCHQWKVAILMEAKCAEKKNV